MFLMKPRVRRQRRPPPPPLPPRSIEETVKNTTIPTLIHLEEQLAPTQLDSSIEGIHHVFYINLDQCTERRHYMETKVLNHSMFSNIQIHRISASDRATNLSYPYDKSPGYDAFASPQAMCGVDEVAPTKLRSNASLPPRLSFEAPYIWRTAVPDIVYACTLSHLRAIERFVETDSTTSRDVALIIEDDVSLEFSPFWRASMQQCIEKAPRDWEILQLSMISLAPDASATVRPKVERPVYDRWNMKKKICGTAAYVITRPAARRLIRFLHRRDASYCIGPPMSAFPQIDVLLYDYLCTYTVYPPPLTYRDDNDSMIHPTHLPAHVLSKEFTKRMYIDASVASSSATSVATL